MDEIEGLINKKEGLKKRPIATCDLCDEKQYLYLCEQGHGSIFCKACLIKTIRRGPEGKEWVAKCNKQGTCNYNPLFEFR